MGLLMLDKVGSGHVFVLLSEIEGFDSQVPGVVRLFLKSGRKVKIKADLVTFALKWFPKAGPFDDLKPDRKQT